MRVATWNVNSVGARLPRLLEWLDSARPDVLCLQETKCAELAFPSGDVEELGYQVAAHGDGRWNGVAILSRAGLDDVTRGFAAQPGFAADPDPGREPTLVELPSEPVVEARAVGATCGPLRVWSVYVPNGRTPDSAYTTANERNKLLYNRPGQCISQKRTDMGLFTRLKCTNE